MRPVASMTAGTANATRINGHELRPVLRDIDRVAGAIGPGSRQHAVLGGGGVQPAEGEAEREAQPVAAEQVDKGRGEFGFQGSDLVLLVFGGGLRRGPQLSSIAAGAWLLTR